MHVLFREIERKIANDCNRGEVEGRFSEWRLGSGLALQSQGSCSGGEEDESEVRRAAESRERQRLYDRNSRGRRRAQEVRDRKRQQQQDAEAALDD